MLSLALLAAATTLPGKWGYSTANQKYGAEYFWWRFPPAQGTSDKLLIWLSGGPGCSSEIGAFMENGPYHLNENGTALVANKYGWNSINHVMYVDQPAPTGFSKLANSDGYVANEEQVAGDFITFLDNFFKDSANAELVGKELYIVGESYAGHYVPAICAAIVKNGNHHNLKGCGVGNGLVDSLLIDGSYAPYLRYAADLIGDITVDAMGLEFAACKAAIDAGAYETAFTLCGSIVQTGMSAASETVCIYNYKFVNPKCGQLCYCQINALTDFLNTADVQNQLQTNKQWGACDQSVYGPLMGDFERSYVDDIGVVLKGGLNWTSYNGNNDIICNSYGQFATVNALEWAGQSNFINAKNLTWADVDGAQAGTVRQYEGFTYAEVHDAGHMVPLDKPAAALAIAEHIMGARSLVSRAV